MVATAQSVQFYDAETGVLVLELVDATLPEESLVLSERLLRSESRYRNSREQTSQVLGVEHDPISLEGLVETYRDAAGRLVSAEDVEESFASAFGAGRPLFFAWGLHVLRGYLDEKRVEIEDEDAFRYSLTFKPTRTRGAKASASIPGRRTTDVFSLDVAERETSRARSWVELLRSVSPFTLEALTAIASTENAINDARAAIAFGFGLAAAARSTIDRLDRMVRGALSAARTVPDLARSSVYAEELEAESLSSISQTANRLRVAGAMRSADRGLREVLRILREREAGKAIERTHVVRDGETLFSISLRYFGTADRWREIYRANGLSSTIVSPGDELRIPRA